jgi:hypothetical protein
MLNRIRSEQKMDGNVTLTAPPPRARIMRRTEIIRNTWAHDIEEGVDWPEALNREYWANVIERFRDGDSVEIHSYDHRIQFVMRIISVNTHCDPMYLEAVFQPIYPADLQLPAMSPQILPRYAVRQAPGSSTFRVIDLETGLPVHDNTKDRHAAMELAAELERGLALSGAQVASAFARQHHTAEHPVTPGAARTRRYRARQRAEATAPAGEMA